MAVRYEIRSAGDHERAVEGVRTLAPGKWVVEVKRLQDKRTLDQNALYWRWLHIIAQETGNDAEEIHEAIKRKFLAPIYVEVFGELVDRRSTTDQSIGDMAALMNKVHAWAHTDLGIHLPLPEERHAA